MEFTKEQLEALKKCHPEADEKFLLREIEKQFERGVPFEYLLQNLPKALDQRANLPWMAEQRNRLFELEQVMGNISELKDNNFRRKADFYMMQSKWPVEQVARVLQHEIDEKKNGRKPRVLPIHCGDVVMTVKSKYEKFCERYELDPLSDDARKQFKIFNQNLKVLQRASEKTDKK